MSATATTRIADLRDALDESPVRPPSGKLARLPSAPAAPEQRVLAIGFRSPDGRFWHAIGGGATAGEAIAFARESCPDDTTWHLVGWNDLYGD